jgi:hypothetical protein
VDFAEGRTKVIRTSFRPHCSFKPSIVDNVKYIKSATGANAKAAVTITTRQIHLYIGICLKAIGGENLLPVSVRTHNQLLTAAASHTAPINVAAF